MGPQVQAILDRPGFYPAGGGKCRVLITPTPTLQHFDLSERGDIRARRAQALVANLARHIAERELAVISHNLGWPAEWLQIVQVDNSPGPGKVVTITSRVRM
jgi:RNA 3'-terminal phosphate cyclase (ATP)